MDHRYWTPDQVKRAHRLSVAPMMDWTDRHFRLFVRRISRQVLLYTEMVTTGAILHGNREWLLGYSPEEHPLVLQLGGDDPAALAECAHIAEDLGYAEVNLNVGCPSDRVQRGRFGACLMRHPEVVAEGVAAIRARVDIPVTVKHRIGVDELDAYEDMARFVSTVAAAGCDTFIVHARKAWLQGLSPKENREIPPLRYDDVYRLKRELPHLRIEINGGITRLDQVLTHLEHLDGVMMGRAIYDDPWLLADADARIFGVPGSTPPSRHAFVEQLYPYLEARLAEGEPLARLTRHMLNLFHGKRGARGWRRHLSEQAWKEGAGLEVVREALKQVPQAGEYEGDSSFSAPGPTPLHRPPAW